MTTFEEVRQSFIKEANQTVGVPDMSIWAPKIRSVNPKGAVYVILFKEFESGFTPEWFYGVLLPNDINWEANKKNDPAFRSTYFHVSKSDSNIWILKNDFRRDTEVVKKLITKDGYAKLG